MVRSKQDAISDIRDYIARRGGSYNQWYIGIASSPRQRLFKDHAVSEAREAWIYRECASSAAAREVEQFFLGLGMKGGAGGGDLGSKSAYAYKISLTTRE